MKILTLVLKVVPNHYSSNTLTKYVVSFERQSKKDIISFDVHLCLIVDIKFTQTTEGQ